MITKIIML